MKFEVVLLDVFSVIYQSLIVSTTTKEQVKVLSNPAAYAVLKRIVLMVPIQPKPEKICVEAFKFFFLNGFRIEISIVICIFKPPPMVLAEQLFAQLVRHYPPAVDCLLHRQLQ